MSRFALLFMGALLIAWWGTDDATAQSNAWPKSAAETEVVTHLQYGKPINLCKLEHKHINESSGIAASQRDSNLFWTHNDSGDRARLFCFDLRGKHQGICRLKSTKAVDWEDVCSFTSHGHPKLLIADTGDNTASRRSCRLHLLDEPPKPGCELPSSEIQTIDLRYSTGAMDCEAIGIDVQNEKLLLVEKRRWIHCRVFEADFPLDPETGWLDVKRLPEAQQSLTDLPKLIAKPIAQIKLALVSAMDVAPDGRRAVVMTLGEAVEFIRVGNQTWKEAFQQKPQIVHLPARRQGEAICYGADGRDLFLTSEMTPTPFFRVPAK